MLLQQNQQVIFRGREAIILGFNRDGSIVIEMQDTLEIVITDREELCVL